MEGTDWFSVHTMILIIVPRYNAIVIGQRNAQGLRKRTCTSWCVPYSIHSKNSSVIFDPERVSWCQTHFWGQTDQKTRSDWPGIRVRKTFVTLISCQFDPDSWSVWPGNGSGPMGPFLGPNLTREFLDCTCSYNIVNNSHVVFINENTKIFYLHK